MNRQSTSLRHSEQLRAGDVRVSAAVSAGRLAGGNIDFSGRCSYLPASRSPVGPVLHGVGQSQRYVFYRLTFHAYCVYSAPR